MKRLLKKPLSRETRIFSFGFLVSLFALICIFAVEEIFSSLRLAQYDDSYITYRYVENLISGKGFRFNQDDLTNSSSSFLYAMLLAILTRISLVDVPTIGASIGVISLALSGGIIAAFSVTRTFTKLGVITGIAAAAILVSNPTLLYWAFSGMETTLFMLLMLIAIFMTHQIILMTKITFRMSLITCTSMVALSLIRWEGAVLALILSTYIIFSNWQIRKNRSTCNWNFRFSPFISSCVAIGILLTFYRFYYGHFIPDSLLFKKLSNYYTQSPSEILGIIRVYIELRLNIYILVFAFLVMALTVLINLCKRDQKQFYANLTPVLALISSILVVVFGAYSDEFRYIAPITGIAVALLIFLPELLSHVREIYKTQVTVLAVLSLVFATSHSVHSGIFLSREIMNGLGYQYLQSARIETGKWIEANLPTNSIILSEDIGAISFYSPSLKFIDASGLNNHNLLTGIQLGQSYAANVIKAEPSYLVGTTDKNLQTGSEWIFENPQKYYDPKSILVKSDCLFSQAFDKRLINQLPKNESVPLTITVWKLTPTGKCFANRMPLKSSNS